MTIRRRRVGPARAARPSRATLALRYGTSRRSRAGLVLLALLLSMVPMLGRVAHAQTASTTLPLTLTVTRITPTAPQPGDELTVGGVLSNPTDLSYDDLSIALRLDATPLTSRAALLAVATSTDHIPSDDAGVPKSLGTLAAGASVPYTLQVPVDQLPLDAPGVYRISVEAYRGDVDNREFDARVNTFLPWLPPSAAVPPVQVAWVWPLLSTPRLRSDNTITDEAGLGAEVGPRGRLGLLLSVASQAATQSGLVPSAPAPDAVGTETFDPTPTPVPIKPVLVTPVLDPENLQELTLSTDPAVTAYRSELQTLMTQTSSIVTPYGDPDIESLFAAHAGSLVTQARSTGLESGLTGVATGLLWPPDGTLSQGTLDQLTVSGLVLSSRAVPLSNAGSLAYTPTARTDVTRPGGTLPAVVVDDGLSRLATTPVKVADRVLLTQRFAAETAAIALDGGPAGRTLVLAPNRRWSSKGSSIRSIVDETGQLPWVDPVTVPQALQGSPDPTALRDPLHQPVSAANALPAGLAARIAAADAELAGFRSILCPVATTGKGTPAKPSPASASTVTSCATANAQVLQLQRTLYAAASTAFRKPGSGGEAMLDASLAVLRHSVGQVKIQTTGPEVLVGSRPRLAISVVNNLKVPVRVQIVLRTTSNALRASKAVTLTLAAGANVQQDISITSKRAGGGTVVVDAQLLTPTNQNLGAPVPLTVRISAAGIVVVTITIAVCGLLGLAVIVRLYRRIRNARRRPSADAEAADDAGTTDAGTTDAGTTDAGTTADGTVAEDEPAPAGAAAEPEPEA